MANARLLDPDLLGTSTKLAAGSGRLDRYVFNPNPILLKNELVYSSKRGLSIKRSSANILTNGYTFGSQARCIQMMTPSLLGRKRTIKTTHGLQSFPIYISIQVQPKQDEMSLPRREGLIYEKISNASLKKEILLHVTLTRVLFPLLANLPGEHGHVVRRKKLKCEIRSTFPT
jgi:hypothetical protein